MNEWAVAVLPLVGVVLGAALQFWLSRTAERERYTTDQRSQAYADYLRAVAAAAHLRCDEDLRDAYRDAADAKARIAVYGSSLVIKALSQFEEFGATLGDVGAGRAFLAVVSAMRSDCNVVPERELELILLGTAHHCEDAPADAEGHT